MPAAVAESGVNDIQHEPRWHNKLTDSFSEADLRVGLSLQALIAARRLMRDGKVNAFTFRLVMA